MKNETQTDIWVYNMAKEAKIELFPQGSSIVQIDKSLTKASKSGSGNVGRPDFTSLIETGNDEFLILIENKKDTSRHVKYNSDGVIDLDSKSVQEFAVNGALYYALHLLKDEKVPFKKIFAVGISGGEKRHRITPIFIDDSLQYKELEEVETLVNFSSKNIHTYYMNNVLDEETNVQKESTQILQLARELHEALRTYGNLQERDKPLIVSGILLALREGEYGGFSVSQLTGDKNNPDGYKIYQAIESNLRRSNISPEAKRDKLMAQFSIFKTDAHINNKNDELGMTSLRYFAEFLWENIYQDIRFTGSHHDYLGNFYSEFMSYSGGDGQGLGIVLTPAHITQLFCDLADLKVDDVVFDPCCGTGGFLIAAMHNLLSKTDEDDEVKKRQIRQRQLHGIELQDYMFTISTTNMILRGDGKSNLRNENFLIQNSAKIQSEIMPTIGMINPPYSMATRTKDKEQYEINFISRMLDSLVEGGQGIAIVPQSTVTGKTKIEKEIMRDILKKHTLKGVITLNKETFYGVGVNPCIVVFVAGIPHSKNFKSKFIDFSNDGYKVAKHIGLIETPEAKDRKNLLLNVWSGEIEAQNEFCVETIIEPEDELLHSFYYFNEEPPTSEEFEETLADYLSFQLDMVLHGRDYLFGGDDDDDDDK
ncbi:putative type I restriction-modification system methyltransferase subunit [Planococcus sp. PAMC 21323]|uniref:HsdM family class I SAM-dependent methyltransferase n=1 Tax=Planococcus sp. PAMC 21323 TaxID=1526927 RepID=UPI000570B645|nr:N-6 DNA methylase [Planococcus sp. PAMC 21323]AIY04045.1 putative type I restriction-modification system methyltransferase subunit [Planococcus sp. PAMC 21323]